MTHIALRGSSPQFFDACATVLGVGVPTAPNTVTTAGERSVLWLGPDEWLVIDPKPALVGELRAALAGIHSAVVEVSASRRAITVSGERAEETLAKAATLDFSLAAFPVGTCAQTNIARTQGIIERRGAHEFRLFVRTSFAPYLQAWLDDARLEYPA
jgi:sarcosine oxidase subunit gamma